MSRTASARSLPGLIVLCAICGFGPGAAAQTRTLRVVCYNVEADIDGVVSPRPGLIAPPTNTAAVQLGGVLEGIGEEVLNRDPAQPLDILALEETTSSNLTIGPIVSGLNACYSAPNMYAASPYQATESGGAVDDGNGPNSLVYNTYTVQLLASVPVDPPGGPSQLGSASGEYREAVRYKFAPAGMVPAASNEFYVYVSHYKSGTTSTDATDRDGEAQIIRNDEAANLPAGARVLYVGDYNANDSGEAGYQAMLAADSPGGAPRGQGIDPLNVSGSASIDWEDPTTDKPILAMLTEEDYELRYRDDLQIMTANVYGGAPGGLCLVPGTYHAFGNNGSLTYGASVTASTNTALAGSLTAGALISAAQLCADLTNASDHLPVVADYTIPVSVPPVQLGAGILSGAAGFHFVLSNLDGTAITPAEQSRVTIYAAANLAQSWVPLTNAFSLTNGFLQVNDTNALDYPQRFYRAGEKP